MPGAGKDGIAFINSFNLYKNPDRTVSPDLKQEMKLRECEQLVHGSKESSWIKTWYWFYLSHLHFYHIIATFPLNDLHFWSSRYKSLPDRTINTWAVLKVNTNILCMGLTRLESWGQLNVIYKPKIKGKEKELNKASLLPLQLIHWLFLFLNSCFDSLYNCGLEKFSPSKGKLEI